MNKKNLTIKVGDTEWDITPDYEACSGVDFVASDYLVEAFQNFKSIDICEAGVLLKRIPYCNLHALSAFELEKIIRKLGGYVMPEVLSLEDVGKRFPQYKDNPKAMRQTDEHGYTGSIHLMDEDGYATHYVIYKVEYDRTALIQEIYELTEAEYGTHGDDENRFFFCLWVRVINNQFRDRDLKPMTQSEFSKALDICPRSFRRYMNAQRVSWVYQQACNKLRAIALHLN